MMTTILSISFVLMSTAVCAIVAEESGCVEETGCLRDQTCGREKGCPNTFICIKRNCCRHKMYRDCGAIMSDDCNDIPKKCQGGESIKCPESTHTCYTAIANLFNMCCPNNVTCTDETGVDHKPTDKPWISTYDKCSKCECLKNGTIACKYKKRCHHCKVKLEESAVTKFKRGDVYWKNCKRFTCISQKHSLAEGPCEMGKKGLPSEFTPLADNKGGCNRQARITMCYYSPSDVPHRPECSSAVDYIRELNTNETHKDACPKPGERITEEASIIVGGDEVKPKYNYKWMVYFDLPTGRCGGSIISPQHILTAAHCLVKMRDGENFALYTGKHNVTEVEPFEQKRTVTVNKSSNVFIHDGYNSSTFNNDIAIVVIEPPLEFNHATQPIDLASNHDLKKGSHCRVIGWGKASQKTIKETHFVVTGAPFSDVLLEAKLTNFTCDMPIDATMRFNAETMFCASNFTRKADKRKDSCRGDSGGPLMCSKTNAKGIKIWTQYGIVSWGPVLSNGIQCGQYSGVYTKVANFMSWIEQNVTLIGEWGSFTNYTACTATCGKGRKSRIRICTDLAPVECIGEIGEKREDNGFISDTEIVTCNEGDCE